MTRLAPLLVVLCAGVLALATVAAPRASSSASGIDNVTTFLERCPTNDPMYAQIRSDFELRREGVVVGTIACTEPISAMPIDQYTDELIAVQTLRAIYYMEGGRDVAYPWTSGSLYDWMKSQTGGIDLRVNGSYCCSQFNDEWYPVIATQNTFDRNDDRKWQGISNQITLLAHETRHIDAFPHVGHCPLFPDQSYGCDVEYNVANLSPYAVEWWLNWKWLTGELYVGFSCAAPATVSAIASFHQTINNNNYSQRFAGTSPPSLSIPAQPGGPCQATGQTPVPTASPTPSQTASPTPAPTPSVSPTLAPSPLPSVTASPTATQTPAPSLTPTATPTEPPTPEPTPPASPVETSTPTTTDLPPPPAPTSTPTPSASPTEAPSPTTPPPPQANVNCDGVTDQRDLLLLLEAAGGLSYSQPSGCTAPGAPSGDGTAGDLDCSGTFDTFDVLALLRYLSGIALDGC